MAKHIANMLRGERRRLSMPLVVKMPLGDEIMISSYTKSSIEIHGQNFAIELESIPIEAFDVILEMYSISRHDATIDFHEKEDCIKGV